MFTYSVPTIKNSCIFHVGVPMTSSVSCRCFAAAGGSRGQGAGAEPPA